MKDQPDMQGNKTKAWQACWGTDKHEPLRRGVPVDIGAMRLAQTHRFVAKPGKLSRVPLTRSERMARHATGARN